MRKMSIILIVAFILSGCAYEGKNLGDYLDDPASLIQDPHFVSYKEKRDDLERQYLRKEISYADYIKTRDELDQKYDMEVQKRDSIIGE